MKLSVDKSEFMSLINKVSQASNDKANLPIFGCVLLDVKDKSVTVSGGDGVVFIKSSIACDVSKVGQAGVSAKLLRDVIQNLPEGVITMELVGNKVRIGNKKAAVNLVTVDPVSFMPLPNYNSFEYQPCNDLFEAVKKVKFVIKPRGNGDRPYLSGIFVDYGKAIATDGHRLSVAAHTVIQPNSYIIDGDGLGRAHKALEKEVFIFVDSNRAHFKSGETNISVALIEGKYPDYNRFIPSGTHIECSIKKSELESALDLLDVVVDSKSRNVVLSFENNRLNLSSNTESSDSSQDLDIDYTSEAMKIGFDLKYLAEAIKQIKGDNVVIEIRNPTSPVIIKEEGYVHVIMPKRI